MENRIHIEWAHRLLLGMLQKGAQAPSAQQERPFDRLQGHTGDDSAQKGRIAKIQDGDLQRLRDVPPPGIGHHPPALADRNCKSPPTSGALHKRVVMASCVPLIEREARALERTTVFLRREGWYLGWRLDCYLGG